MQTKKVSKTHNSLEKSMSLPFFLLWVYQSVSPFFRLNLANIYYPVFIATVQNEKRLSERMKMAQNVRGKMRINNDRMHPKIRKEREN